MAQQTTLDSSDDKLMRYLIYAVLGALAIILGIIAVQMLISFVSWLIKMVVIGVILVAVLGIAYKILT